MSKTYNATDIIKKIKKWQHPVVDGRFTELRKVLADCKIPEWDGVSKVNRMLVLGEGGYGDELVHLRHGRFVKKFANYLGYGTINNLVNVIKTSRLFDELFDIKYTKQIKFDYNFIENIEKFETYDAWVSLFLLGVKVDYSIDSPYINVCEKLDKEWKTFTKTNKIKVGIRFSGSFLNDLDQGRNLPIDQILPIFNENYKLYSFQVFDGLDIVSQYPNLNDLSDKLVDWENTLAALNNMDIVISSCTSVAHASAILNQKTIVLVPHNCYHVWVDCDENNIHSDWYLDNVICFKQKTQGDWSWPLSMLKKYFNYTDEQELKLFYN